MKNKNYILILIIFTSIFISKEAISQKAEDKCDETVHGIRNLHLDCFDDIFITSLDVDVDGDVGTIIQGVITTSKSSRIQILPGYTSVRIIPIELDPHPKQLRTHTTKLGNGGKTVNATKRDHVEKPLNQVILFPNPSKNNVSIQSTANKIIGYQLVDPFGKIIKKEQIKPVLKYSLTLYQLKTGMYWLKIQLETGTFLTRKMFKK